MVDGIAARGLSNSVDIHAHGPWYVVRELEAENQCISRLALSLCLCISLSLSLSPTCSAS